MCSVERTETLILWSGSLADKTLRVWRHRLTSDEPDIAEVKVHDNTILIANRQVV